MATLARDVKIVDATGSIDERMVRKYVITYRVCLTTVCDVLEASAVTGLPALFSTYSYKNGRDRDAWLRSYDDPRRDENDPKVWLFTARYSSERSPRRWSESPVDKAGGASGTQNRGDGTELDPLQRPWDVNWGGQTYQKGYEIDFFGFPTVNTVGQPFDPAPERDHSTITFTITRNESTFNERRAADYADAVNNDVIKLPPPYGGGAYQPGEVKCGTITAQSQAEGPYFFYRVTYPCAVRRNYIASNVLTCDSVGQPFVLEDLFLVHGWDDLVLNCGYEEAFTDTNGNVVFAHIFDERTGTPVARPRPLDEIGQHVVLDRPEDICYRRFRPYRPMAFKSLGIFV